MFGKLKEKLKSWFKSSSEKIEEIEEEKEKSEIAKAETDEEKEVIEEKIEKVEKLIEKSKEIPYETIPTRFDTKKGAYEPDLEKTKESLERLREDIKKVEKEKKDIEKFEEELERVKRNEAGIEEVQIPMKFETGRLKYEPDLEKLGELEKGLKEKKEEGGVGKGFFARIKEKFSHKISENEFNEIFEDLEMLLLENNVALEAAEGIREKLAKKLVGLEIRKNEIESRIKDELKKTLFELLIEPDNPLEIIKISKKPFKILFFGINGTGKTTTIAKVASFLRKSGFSVVMAAGDTFRAASIEQLSEHAKRLGIKVVKQNYGADPAAVAFDAIKYAEKHKIDVVLIDTAGRMHTKDNLLNEMEKIVRVTKPDLKIFVGESIAGNDAVEQARTFNEKIEIDGSILTKADVDEKGGTIISVSYATKKPIFYLGLGQNYEDLELFNKQKFVDSLLG